MTEGFERTRQTADEASATARMLTRVADGRGAIAAADVGRLKALAGRYEQYAAALLDSVAGEAPEPAADQVALL